MQKVLIYLHKESEFHKKGEFSNTSVFEYNSTQEEFCASIKKFNEDEKKELTVFEVTDPVYKAAITQKDSNTALKNMKNLRDELQDLTSTVESAMNDVYFAVESAIDRGNFDNC